MQRLSPEKSARVVFVTTGFGATPTGPSVYAHYLWDGFRDDPDVEFHLVAPEFPFAHPRAHATGKGRGSLELYDDLCRKAREVADALGAGVIIHANNSHLGRRLLATRHRLWGQLNDYQNVEVYRNLPRILRYYGPRRALALLRRRWLERQSVARQDLTLCNSRYTRQRALEAYRPPHSERLVVVYKAVDLGFFRRPTVLPPDPAGRDPGRFRILFIGSDFVVKGLDVLVEACLHLKVPAHLCVVGVEEAAFRGRFGSLADRLRASGFPYWFGGRLPRERVRALLWHSDLFALPSRSEAFGVAILEALAAGVPVVASRVGGVPEIVDTVGGGDLVPRVKPEPWCEALEARAQESGGFDREAVRARLEERFSSGGMLRTLRSLYLQ